MTIVYYSYLYTINLKLVKLQFELHHESAIISSKSHGTFHGTFHIFAASTW